MVLSIGSNLGDRMARLQSVVDTLGAAVCAVSPVYETAPWGGVDQGPYLNAVVVAEDPGASAHDWLQRAQAIERANERVRDQRWGPRTLDVDLVSGRDASNAVVVAGDDRLALPHPLAHLRAFVLIPWLAVEPDAELMVAGISRSAGRLLAEIDRAERDGVRPTDLMLRMP